MTTFMSPNLVRQIPPGETALLTQIMRGQSSDDEKNAFHGTIMPSQKDAKYSFYYVNNPDGSIRWIVPQQAEKPHFLALYNSNSLKAWIYKQGVQLGYTLGQKRSLFQGEFSLADQHSWALPELLFDLAGHEYAIFTGTAGNTRKTVAAIAPKGNVTHFIKIAHTDRAQSLIDNEGAILQKLSNKNWKTLQIPEVTPLSQDNMLMLSNVNPQIHENSAELTNIHIQGLKEIWESTSEKKVEVLSWVSEIKNKLSNLPDPADFPNDLNKKTLRELINNLKCIEEELSQEKTLPVSLAHGDFTPWNMYVTQKHLHLFDWEYAREDYPLYFDFFHYFYQSEILLRRKSRDLFLDMAEMASLYLGPSWQQMHKWYLLITLTNYLSDYSTWKNVFMQAHWLIDAWNRIVSQIN